MANDTSTINSLKAVDAWIDVINANINGGVRTAYKSSRLKFGGSNVTVGRAGNASSLPLQFPESGLTTANTVIDFSQGAITTSTENTHLAVQGEGFFILLHPSCANATGGYTVTATQFNHVQITRDGEFHTNQNGQLVAANGWYLITGQANAAGTNLVSVAAMRTVYNDLDLRSPNTSLSAAVKLSDFLTNTIASTTLAADGVTAIGTATNGIIKVDGKQDLRYTSYGSTVLDFGAIQSAVATYPNIRLRNVSTSTILNKSLEASNASMTQSVPELSLAQKLFSALTKVLQISQTNTDAVLNLIR